MAETPAAISTPSVDFDQIRKDFPVLSEQVRDKPLVYLDNGASSQMPAVVADRLDHYHRHEHANVHRGIHHLSQKATDVFEDTRKKVQQLSHAEHLHEVVYTTGITDSINLVAHSFGQQFISDGDEIGVSEIEHHANIVPWQIVAQQNGAKVRVIPVNEDGAFIWV